MYPGLHNSFGDPATEDEMGGRSSNDLQSLGTGHQDSSPDNGGQGGIPFSVLTVTAIDQIGPDDALLWETEHTEAATAEGVIPDVARIRHQINVFIQPEAAINQEYAKWFIITLIHK